VNRKAVAHVKQPSIPTVRELARRLGLHHSTVARALSNHPGISSDTRARVLREAEKSGYRANALVNALMTQVRQRHRLKPTGEVVAFLTGFSAPDAWRDFPSVVSQFEGAAERARSLGFHLQPMWLGHQGENARQAAGVMKARGVRGSLLSPGTSREDQGVELDWDQHACVAIGYSFQQVPLHRAVHDSVNIVTQCHDHLHATGHRRIGIALPDRYGTGGRHLWINGYLGAQWSRGLKPIPPFIYDADIAPARFSQWLARHRLDAIIGLWPDQPLAWLRREGIHPPHDIGYATLDLGDRLGQVAGMLQDNYRIGDAAMDLLAGQLFCNEIGIPTNSKIIMVEGAWVDGPTVSGTKESLKSAR